MGFTLGPILSMYLTAFQNGAQLVMLAMGGTGAIFLGLSAYTLQTRSNFSYMGGFLTAGVLVAFFAGLGAIFFQVPALMIAVSAMFVLLMAGMILYQTSELVHGGETNYILATVGLYVSIYNLFTSLLQLLGVFGGDD
jgi:modulator of FtsH protease